MNIAYDPGTQLLTLEAETKKDVLQLVTLCKTLRNVCYGEPEPGAPPHLEDVVRATFRLVLRTGTSR